MRETIRVLLLAADPFRGEAPREMDEELRAIEHAVRRGPARHALELVAHAGTRAHDVRAALLRHQPQVVHVAAPGDGPAAIYLAGDDGRRRPVDGEALRGLLGGARDSVRVVLLNGAGTLPAVEALREVADYTIGTNRGAGDASAIVFSAAFYRALAMGCTVLAAFELGLSQVTPEGNPEGDMPVRRIRRGVNLDDTLVSGQRAGGAELARPRTRAPARRSG